jgi:hypothetical protein
MATVSTDLPEEPILRPDPWRIAWTILASNAMLASVLLAMALLLALAAWLPQAPDSITDPVAFSRWRSETQIRFGSAFTPLQEVGLFALEHSAILRGLLALTILCLILRIVEHAQAAWHARRFQPPPKTVQAETSVELPLEDIAAALQRRKLRVVCEGDVLCANRFPGADLGQFAIHLGAVIVIASLAVSNLMGWRASHLTLGVGQMIPVNAQRGTLSVRLDSLDPAHRGQVTLLQETDVIGTGSLSPNWPLELAGLTISLNGVGPAVRASATLTDGQVVSLQAAATLSPTNELLLLLTRDEPDRWFVAPKVDLAVQLSRGAGAPYPLRAQVYRSRTGAVLFDGNVPLDGSLSIENITLHLSTETHAMLDVVRDPARPCTLIGIAILALGWLLAAFWPVTWLWAIRTPNGTKLVGDAPAVQAIAPGLTLLNGRERVRHLVTTVGGQIGLAILGILAGLFTALDLVRGQPVWAEASITPAFLAIWLSGCSAALWAQRAIRWAALAFSVIALVAVVLWPRVIVPPGF